MRSITPLFLALFFSLLSLSVEAKKDAATGPPKRLKVETTFTPANCNRKSRKSKAGDRLKVNYVSVCLRALCSVSPPSRGVSP
jgi:hypothetical protein